MFSIGGGTDDHFDPYDTFEPAHVPEASEFLTDAAVLQGADHAAFHRLTRALFEERGVYDVTFGYNLARLNLDRRHPDAGFRYAREERNVGDGDRLSVLRAEFTPTTKFCPQSEQLAKAASRAWNGLAGRHEYDCVVVRVASMHQDAAAINAELAGLDPDGDATASTDASLDAIRADGPNATDEPTEEGTDGVPGGFGSPF